MNPLREGQGTIKKLTKVRASVKSKKKKSHFFLILQKHSTIKRGILSQMTSRTLGSGNMREAVLLPPGEDRNEWIATNTVDFFNEISLLYGLVSDQAQEKFTKPGEGFPVGFEYLWADSEKKLCVGF